MHPDSHGPIFLCPICNYRGPFGELLMPSGVRRYAQCPRCNALERHRVQWAVVSPILKGLDCSRRTMLHIAPEQCLRPLFVARFGRYDSAGLYRPEVDYDVDLQALPFDDGSYDFVFASHVLEHVREDEKAIAEIRRILKADGIAVLPVPVVAEKTVEYPEPNPHESFHVRAPGFDYYDRYERHFTRVERISSASLPGEYQPYVYEDRTRWPTKECPLRPPMAGERHVEIVPVCYA